MEDDERVLESLAEILEQQGYVVDTAMSGKEAIDRSNSEFYNLALIDIRLPDMEGTALLTTMRETMPKMAKVVLTGYPTVENAIECVNNHADGYLIKPVDTVHLLKTIETCLERQEETDKFCEQRARDFMARRTMERSRVPGRGQIELVG